MAAYRSRPTEHAAASHQHSYELLWKPLFDTIDRRQLRRGRLLVDDGVHELSLRDGMVMAKVRGRGPGGVYRVCFPLVGDWRPYQESVVRWLHNRPDWLAGLVRGTVADDFLEHVAAAGLSLFPDEAYAARFHAQAECTCPDLTRPCPHLVAAVYAWVQRLEQHPLQLLASVGLDPEVILDEVHSWTWRELREREAIHETEYAVDHEAESGDLGAAATDSGAAVDDGWAPVMSHGTVSSGQEKATTGDSGKAAADSGVVSAPMFEPWPEEQLVWARPFGDSRTEGTDAVSDGGEGEEATSVPLSRQLPLRIDVKSLNDEI
jgi:uncharacterized Zn finger protein